MVKCLGFIGFKLEQVLRSTYSRVEDYAERDSLNPTPFFESRHI